MSLQIKNSIFLKMINSSSYYFKNKTYIDDVFKEISAKKSYLLYGIEINDKKLNYVELKNKIAEANKNNHEKYDLIELGENNHILIVGFDKDLTDKNKISKSVVKNISQSSNNYLVSVSNVISSLGEVFEAYMDIKICKEYHVVGKQNDMVDIEKINLDLKLYCPNDIKDKISNFFIMGKKKETLEIINSIIDTNVERGIYYVNFKLLINNLSNIIFEVLFDYKNDTADVLMIGRLIDKQLQKGNNLDVKGIKNILANVIRMANINEPKGEKGARLNRNEIINYIINNYDKDLYLDKMAEIFGTTPKYFSNFFSRGGNEGFLEYLTKVRVSKAKELLENTDMKISDIALKVGYSNTATFTNTFKKQTGVSPVLYRELKASK